MYRFGALQVCVSIPRWMGNHRAVVHTFIVLYGTREGTAGVTKGCQVSQKVERIGPMIRRLTYKIKCKIMLISCKLLALLSKNTSDTQCKVSEIEDDQSLTYGVAGCTQESAEHEQQSDVRRSEQICSASREFLNSEDSTSDLLLISPGSRDTSHEKNIADAASPISGDLEKLIDHECVKGEVSDGEVQNSINKTGTSEKQNVKSVTMFSGRRGQSGRKYNPSKYLKPASKPKVICRFNREKSHWEVAIADSADFTIKYVNLNNQRYDVENGLFVLPSISRNILVESHNGTVNNIDMTSGGPLLFKSNKCFSGHGKMAKNISIGYYIIFSHDNVDLPGRCFCDPEGSLYPDLKVHFRHCNTDLSQQEYLDYNSVGISANASWMMLSGTCVHDDLEKGDLYVGNPPKLECSSDIDQVLVGYEDKKSWRELFDPNQDMLSSIIGTREGWFFLRGYCNGERVVSEQFRLLCKLEKIKIDGEVYAENTMILPGSEGYNDTVIDLCGVAAYRVDSYPIAEENRGYKNERGTVLVPRDFKADTVDISVKTESGSVKVLILMPRLWWRIESQRSDSSTWIDTPVTMTQSEYMGYAMSNAKLCILSRKSKAVLLGFNTSKPEEYGRNIADEVIEVPMIEFNDYDEVRKYIEKEVYLSATVLNKTYKIIEIRPEQSNQMKSSSDARLVQMNTMNVNVVQDTIISRNCNSWYKGRGYSTSELAASGWTAQLAKKHRIRIDKRRRSCHAVNLIKLKEIKNV